MGVHKTSRPRLRAGAAIAATLTVVVLVLATAAWTVFQARRDLRDRVLEETRVAARMSASLIAAELRGGLHLVESFAGRRFLRRAVMTADVEAAEQHLRELMAIEPRFTSAAILDEHGTLWTRTPYDREVVGVSLASRPYYRGALTSDGAFLSDAYLQRARPYAHVVALSIAIRDPRGEPLAVLNATLAADELDLGHELGLGSEASLVVIDSSGAVVAGPRADPTRTYRGLAPVAAALRGAATAGVAPVPGVPGRRLAAYEPVRGLGWAVAVERPLDSGGGALDWLTTGLGMVGVLLLVGSLVAALLLVRLIGQLERQRNLSSAVLEGIGEGVIITDPEGRVTSVNRAICRLTGLPAADLIGRDYADAFPAEHDGIPIAWEDRVLKRALDAREIAMTEGFGMTLIVADGQRIPIAATASPILTDRGELVGAVAVVRDISREREIDDLKGALVSMVSHELRTPLTMIQGFSELLLERQLSEDRERTALHQINVSAHRLSRLVDDLLSVSRIESGQLEVDLGPVALHEVVDDALAALPPDREIHVDVPLHLPTVRADRDRLLQVVTNLVTNADRYSPSEAPIVVEAVRRGDAVEVSVRDRGVGIAADDVPRLFQKFSRVGPHEKRPPGGTGLGLFITKHLVEAMGGTIAVDSVPGEGSTFRFTLPATVSAEQEVR
jgi:PAS domain S-box-containing protein